MRAVAVMIRPASRLGGWVSIPADQALGALRLLLRSSHLAGPDDLPVLASGAGACAYSRGVGSAPAVVNSVFSMR